MVSIHCKKTNEYYHGGMFSGLYLIQEPQNAELGRLVFLAHRIRISEIYPGLDNLILTRLSREGYIHSLYWNSRTLSPSDVIVILK